MADPRYVIARYIAVPVRSTVPALARAGFGTVIGRGRPNAVVYHAVPTVLGGNGGSARHFAAAWSRWVSVAMPV